MGATGQSYSNAAFGAALRRQRDLGGCATTGDLLDAAHDRESLGLEASAHAASYRREVIEEVAAELRTRAVNNTDGHVLRWAADFLLREFGATETKP